MKSVLEKGSVVPLAAFTGERVYMRKFLQADGLPQDLKRWQPTVDAMLDGIKTDLPIFLMVDQRVVEAGSCHRRPGVHVDGYWHDEISAHGGHRPTPSHGPTPPGHGGHSVRGAHETLVLASDVLGCAAYVGRFDGTPGDGGDCSHVDLRGGARVELLPGVAWRGETGSLLHESLPLLQSGTRTVVRLNVRRAA